LQKIKTLFISALLIILCVSCNKKKNMGEGLIQLDSSLNAKSFIFRAIKAINNEDYETLESLRDEINNEKTESLIKYWDSSLSWDIKDAFAYILMDQSGSIVKPAMEDALDSPTVETKAYAYVSLTGNFKEFEKFLVNGFVSEEKVNKAIKKYRGQ